MTDLQRRAVVVGAGVIGSSVALQLARRGWAVTVVDRGPGAGFGSTSASSAMIRFNYSTLGTVATAWESAWCWRHWADYLGAPAGTPLARFHRTGAVALDSPDLPARRPVPLYDEVGVPYDWWDADELARRVPGIDPGRHYPPVPVDSPAFAAPADGTLGALFTPDAGFVDDPRLAAQNLADAARAAGAVFRFGARVTGLDQDDSGSWHVALGDGDEALDAPVVVNAAGPWSAALDRLAGVEDDFTVGHRPLRQEVHHVEAPPGYFAGGTPGPGVMDMDLGTYMRPGPVSGFIVGGAEPACDPLEWLDDPDDAVPHPTHERFEAQVLRAARRFPGLRVPGRPVGVVGVYDVAEDWTPIYDATSRPGFYVAVGTSGNQFKNAPLAGEFLALIVEETRAGRDHDADPVHYTGRTTGIDVDLSAFSRRRPHNALTAGNVAG